MIGIILIVGRSAFLVVLAGADLALRQRFVETPLRSCHGTGDGVAALICTVGGAASVGPDAK